ncbi:MAG: hypothetical protein U0R69_09015 [Gaiellales bacterium]
MTEPNRAPEKAGRSRTESTRLYVRIGLIVLAVVAVIWFIAANTKQVSVQWFVVETTSPLFLVIVLSAVLGAVIDRLLVWRRGRKK